MALQNAKIVILFEGIYRALVIMAGDLAATLERFCGFLRKQGDDEAYEIRHDMPNEDSRIAPSLAVVITFDPKTLKSKTITISSEKKIAKAWIKRNS